MKNLILLFGAFLCMAASCKSVKMDSSADAKKLVEFARSACYGNCPHYHVAINTDGTVVYTGKRNVDKIGIYQYQLTKKEYKDLYKSLEKADLYQYKDIYDAQIADGQVTRVTYHGEKGVKKVATKFKYPGNLKQIVDELDAVSNRETAWVAIDVPEIKADDRIMDKENEEMTKEDQPTRKVFSYSQGACFGKCPVFSFDVLSDRTIIYVGKRYAAREGIYEKKLSEKRYASLMALAESSEFGSLEASYDQDIMDAQQFVMTYFDNSGVKKTVKTKITRPEVVLSIIEFAKEMEGSRGWEKKEAKDSNDASKTILISLKPTVKANRWVTTKKHLKLKIVRYLSPNGTYFLVTYDQERDRNRVMEELRRDEDVLAVSPGDQPAKPRGDQNGPRAGKSGKKGKANIGGNRGGNK